MIENDSSAYGVTINHYAKVTNRSATTAATFQVRARLYDIGTTTAAVRKGMKSAEYDRLQETTLSLAASTEVIFVG